MQVRTTGPAAASACGNPVFCEALGRDLQSFTLELAELLQDVLI